MFNNKERKKIQILAISGCILLATNNEYRRQDIS